LSQTTAVFNMCACALCDFFIVCVRESREVFYSLCIRWKINDMERLSVGEAEIVDRMRNLNINKSLGPDLIHPRILYELRNEQ